jgi:hypothetical protein
MDPRAWIVVAGIGCAAALQGTVGEANAARGRNDFRYTPDPRVMKVVAGGHRSTVADILWLRALPDMARQFEDRELKKRWIAGATDVITDLEPGFGTVYDFGGSHLTIVERDADEAIKLLEKGIRHNPDSAGLRVALAMVHYQFKKDRVKTVQLLDQASKLPGIDSLSLAMLASMKVDERDDLVAIGYWARAVDEAPNPKVKTICEHELWRTKTLVAVRAAKDFEKKHGRRPDSPAELRDPSLMDARVIDAVVNDLQFDDKGRPRYARELELARQVRIYQADDYVQAFRNGTGREPTEAEFMSGFGDLPPPPAGMGWKYADGKLSLVGE